MKRPNSQSVLLRTDNKDSFIILEAFDEDEQTVRPEEEKQV